MDVFGDSHQAMRAVCRAAGWPFCEEHKRPMSGGTNPCWALHHTSTEPNHEYWCEFPDRECICPPLADPAGAIVVPFDRTGGE